jgi:hypothetical protein
MLVVVLLENHCWALPWVRARPLVGARVGVGVGVGFGGRVRRVTSISFGEVVERVETAGALFSTVRAG